MSAHAQSNAEVLPWARAEHHPRFRHASAALNPCPPWPARSEEAKKGRTRRRLTACLAVTVAAGMLLWGCAAKPRVCRVGIPAGLEQLCGTVDGFKATMTELGYTEGRNIAYEPRMTHSDPAAEKQILKSFVTDKKDLVLAFPGEQALPAKEATRGTSIPVVFATRISKAPISSKSSSRRP